jgi:outer membrane protein W
MKKYFLFLALGLTAFANAQTGSWYVGGTAGFLSSKIEDQDAISTWILSPEVGTFFTDNVQVGVGFNIAGGSNDNGSGFGLTPYSRYFFKPGESFRPFVGAGVPFSTSKYDDAFGTEITESSFGLNLNAGFGYALSPSWTVIGQFAALGFDVENRKAGSAEVKSTYFSLLGNTLGAPFNVGLYYTFKK